MQALMRVAKHGMDVVVLLAVCAAMAAFPARAANIPATAGSLNGHVWSNYTPSPVTNLSSANSSTTAIASGVFNVPAAGNTAPVVAISPSFNVYKLSGPTSGLANRIASYAPGSGPVAGTGYPTTAVEQHEVGFTGLSATPRTMLYRYQFAAALPNRSIVWAQDADLGEVITYQFFDCAGALVNPSTFDYYLLSTSNQPAAVFGATSVVLTGAVTNVAEPAVGIVINSSAVCRVEYVFSSLLDGTLETYFSVPAPRLTLIKALGGNRIVDSDQFNMQITQGTTLVSPAATSTSTGTGATVTAGTGTTGSTSVSTGTTYTLTEIASGTTVLNQYAGAIQCTNATAGSTTVLPVGTGQSFSITPLQPNDIITCTLTNKPVADLSITKTNNLTGVASGSQVTYVVTVTNLGPATVTGAVVRDTIVGGLACAGTNSVTVGGTGPAPPGGPFTVANLTSAAGITLATLTALQTNTFSFQCTVN